MVVTRDLHCTCFRLRKTSRRITSLYDAALAPLGLTITQMNVLTMLGASGPQPISTLADALGMDSSTMSRTLRPLLSRGAVVAERGTEDRRLKQIALTEAGTRLLHEAVPLWRVAQTRVERALGRDLTGFHEALARLAEQLDAGPLK